MRYTSYDPEKDPELDARLIQKAKMNDLKIIRLILLDDEGNSTISFVLCDFLPRIGEAIVAQDKYCTVTEVLYDVGALGGVGLLTPTIIAHLDEKNPEEV